MTPAPRATARSPRSKSSRRPARSRSIRSRSSRAPTVWKRKSPERIFRPGLFHCLFLFGLSAGLRIENPALLFLDIDNEVVVIVRRHYFFQVFLVRLLRQ